MYLTRRLADLRIARSVGRRFFFRRSTEKDPTVSDLFNNDLLKSSAGFKKLNESVRANCDVIVKSILEGREDRTTVQLFDDLSNEICKAADLVECVRQLLSDSSFNEAAEESARDFCQLVERYATPPPTRTWSAVR